MATLDLKALRHFVSVAESLSFARAAERLGTSQPVVTRTVAQLEHNLGAKLFERTTRRVALTPAGVVLLKAARPLLGQAEALQRTIRHAVAVESGRLSIGTTKIAMQTVAPAYIRRFTQIRPDIELVVQEFSTSAQIEALLSAEIDVGFVLLPASHSGLTIEPIHSERMMLAVSDGHPCADFGLASPLPLSAFAHDRFIVPHNQGNSANHDEMVSICRQAGFRPKTLESCDDQTCMGLVRAGMGVLFAPMAMQPVSTEGIKLIEIEDPVPTLQIGLAWRKDDPSVSLQLFRDQTRQVEAPLDDPTSA